MKAAFLLGLFLLGACHIDARHSKHHKKKAETPADHEISTQSVKPAENFSPEPATPLGGFAFPGFRIRIPILNFGVLGRMKQQIDNIMNRKQQGLADLPIGGLKAGKTKTRTKMSNSTHGPFKTYTITTETLTQGNKTVKPKVIAKTVKTITTLDKSNLAKAKNGTVLPLAMGPRFGMTSDSAPEGKVGNDSCWLLFLLFLIWSASRCFMSWTNWRLKEAIWRCSNPRLLKQSLIELIGVGHE